MTRLPLEDRNCWGIPGTSYEPYPQCAHPFCDQRRGFLELHHLWPRSFLRNQPNRWVKLPDGRVVGNVIYLCREHHALITENKAQIFWLPLTKQFAWNDEKESGALNPSPPLSPNAIGEPHSEHFNAGYELTDPVAVITPGKKCPTCDRKVPHPKKPGSPETKTISFRLPIASAQEWEEIIEAAGDHLGVPGNQKYRKWVVLEKALVITLQGPPGGEE